MKICNTCSTSQHRSRCSPWTHLLWYRGPRDKSFRQHTASFCLCRNQNCCPEIVYDHPPLELRVLNNAIGHFACRQQWWEEDPLLRTFYFLYTNFKWWASAWMLFVQMFIRMACWYHYVHSVVDNIICQWQNWFSGRRQNNLEMIKTFVGDKVIFWALPIDLTMWQNCIIINLEMART